MLLVVYTRRPLTHGELVKSIVCVQQYTLFQIKSTNILGCFIIINFLFIYACVIFYKKIQKKIITATTHFGPPHRTRIIRMRGFDMCVRLASVARNRCFKFTSQIRRFDQKVSRFGSRYMYGWFYTHVQHLSKLLCAFRFSTIVIMTPANESKLTFLT